jgi:hypothetical protein
LNSAHQFGGLAHRRNACEARAELRGHGRNAETRTPSAWSQARRAHPYATFRKWRWPESNPLRQRLQGAPVTLTVIPETAAAGAATASGRLGSLPFDAHAMDLSSTARHVHPGGWCSQGRRESNPHSAGFGDRPPSRWLIPMKMKTAPRGFPLGRSPSAPPRGYLATIPFLGWLSSRSMAAPDSEHGFSYPCCVAFACQNVMSPW